MVLDDGRERNAAQLVVATEVQDVLPKQCARVAITLNNELIFSKAETALAVSR